MQTLVRWVDALVELLVSRHGGLPKVNGMTPEQVLKPRRHAAM